MKNIRTNLLSSIAMIVITAMFCSAIAGCKTVTVTEAVQKVDAYLPAAITIADTIAANVADLASVYAPQIQVGDVAFDVAARGLKALCDSYLANPDASVLAKIETGVNTLLSQISTAVTNMAQFANPSPALAKAIAGLKDFQTAVTVAFAIISPFETTAQLDQLRDTNTVHLAALRPYMDEHKLEVAAIDAGAAPSVARVAVDAWFAQKTSEGF